MTIKFYDADTYELLFAVGFFPETSEISKILNNLIEMGYEICSFVDLDHPRIPEKDYYIRKKEDK